MAQHQKVRTGRNARASRKVDEAVRASRDRAGQSGREAVAVRPDRRAGRATRVVALVASAGGFEAVTRVLGALPEGFPAAIVVLIHQEPDRASHLVELLDARSALPVVVAQDGVALRPGRVVVTPPGRHVLITSELTIALIASGAAPPNRPSADLLLATLATAVGPGAIAVVLSGGGHDGATGATAIHVFGGTVLATDEATSSSFAMPRAAIERAGIVDRVLALDEVAPALDAIVRSEPISA